MTQEEKQLLLKDLCARLPYGVRVKELEPIKELELYLTSIYRDIVQVETITGGTMACSIEAILPYLRPMSNMTEEEKSIMDSLWKENNKLVFADPDSIRRYRFYDISVVDFLNKRHLDYRGLIEKGLALEAKEGMYKTE